MYHWLPSLEYDLTHPHPKGHVFMLATILIFVLVLPVFVIVNFITLGFELAPSLQPHFQHNLTYLENWLAPRRLQRLFQNSVPRSCQPNDLGRGDSFRLSASLFDYTVMSAWNTTKGTPASGVQEQERVEYRGESFTECYVNNTRFDFSVVEQAQTVTVGVTCPGSADYPIFVSMETSMTFAQQTSKDFIGQYYGPGLDLLNINDIDPTDYRKLVFAALEVISSDSLTIMLGQHLPSPILATSLYFTVSPGTGDAYQEMGTITYVNGTPTGWQQAANIYENTVVNLVTVVNHAVNLDLGSSIYPNIFKNALALNKTILPNRAPQGTKPHEWASGPGTQSIYYGQITPPYQTWAEMLLAGLPVNISTARKMPNESAMVTTYLCPIYQAKPLGPLLASVFAGTATMTMLTWGAWMLFTTYLAMKIMPPQIQCLCDMCQEKEEKEKEEGEVKIARGAEAPNITKPRVFTRLAASVRLSKPASDPENGERVPLLR